MTKSFYFIAIFIVSNITSIAQQNKGIKDRLKEFSTYHNQVATHKKTRAIQQRIVSDSSYSFNYDSSKILLKSVRNYLYNNNVFGSTTFITNQIYQPSFETYCSEENYTYYLPLLIYPKSKILRYYDANFKLNKILFLDYNYTNNAWDTNGMGQLDYNMTTHIGWIKAFGYTNNVINIYPSNYILDTYDSTNNIYQRLFQNVDSNGVYNNDSKQVITYNTNNQQLEFANFNWINNSWIPFSSDSFFYNANNKCCKEIIQLGWDSIGNDYSNKYKKFYTFDALNRIDSVYYIDYNNIHSSWQYFYTSNDSLYSSMNLYFPVSGDTSGVMHLKYDNNKNVTDYYSVPINNQGLLNKFSEDSNHYTYEDFFQNSLPINNSKSINVLTSIFPNPASENTFLSFYNNMQNNIDIQVVNNVGKVVNSFSAKGYIGDHLITLPVKNLANGLYHVFIYSNNEKIGSCKLLKN